LKAQKELLDDELLDLRLLHSEQIGDYQHKLNALETDYFNIKIVAQRNELERDQLGLQLGEYIHKVNRLRHQSKKFQNKLQQADSKLRKKDQRVAPKALTENSRIESQRSNSFK